MSIEWSIQSYSYHSDTQAVDWEYQEGQEGQEVSLALTLALTLLFGESGSLWIRNPFLR